MDGHHPRAHAGADGAAKWDARFLEMARLVGGWSKDPRRKVGCVLVDGKRRVVSVGFNGFARGVSDAPALYADRAAKLRRVIHAEKNAIFFARGGVEGCTAYVTRPPCSQCAAALCQAGVARVVALAADRTTSWADDFAAAAEQLAEAGVRYEVLAWPVGPECGPDGSREEGGCCEEKGSTTGGDDGAAMDTALGVRRRGRGIATRVFEWARRTSRYLLGTCFGMPRARR